jgi:hypothetical protein
MSIKFTKLSKILVIATIASLFSVKAMAETKNSQSMETISLDRAFQDAYFKGGKNAFQQSNIFGQINTILGLTGFPEQHISKDSQAVYQVYQDGTKQQAATGKRIMTRDLVNPYNTSLMENPSYMGTN